MKLIIDRCCNISNFYSFSFGIDFDVLIFHEEFYLPSINKEEMSKIDKIITGSAELKFCVMYIKHPLLLETPTDPDLFITEKTYRTVLRDYFALRLIHRKFKVELYEFGKRLFKD